MSKLNWNRLQRESQNARRRRAVWNAQRAHKPVRHKKELWHRANTSRQINALTLRIESGKEWIMTIPTTDPRWRKWQRALTILIHRRNQLRAS